MYVVIWVDVFVLFFLSFFQFYAVFYFLSVYFIDFPFEVLAFPFFEKFVCTIQSYLDMHEKGS